MTKSLESISCRLPDSVELVISCNINIIGSELSIESTTMVWLILFVRRYEMNGSESAIRTSGKGAGSCRWPTQ